MRGKENYLERIPVRRESISFFTDEKGIVTLRIENRGLYNRIAQRLLKKPKISYVHLDELGSFIWLRIDGDEDIIQIGKAARERFGDAVSPLYERLAKYFKILETCRFIEWKK